MPSEVSEAVVKKSVSFAKAAEVPIIGIIENMSGFVCPDCGKKIDIFKSGGGKKIAQDLSVPYLGSIPIDPTVCTDADKGLAFIIENQDSAAAKAFSEILTKIEQSQKQTPKTNYLLSFQVLKNEGMCLLIATF
jgi:ATP-binding protein involved in chromosome partitioning